MIEQTTGTPPFKRSLSIFLTVLFVISLVLAMLAFNGEVLLLNPGTYKKAIESQGLYARIPGLLAQQLIHAKTYNNCAGDANGCPEESALSSLVPGYMQMLDTAGWEYVLTLALPQQWMKTQSESLIDQFFAALKTSEPQQLVIASGELRTNLTESHYKLIAEALLATAATCSSEELFTIVNVALGQSTEPVPVCIPSEELRPVLENEIQALLLETAQTIPDQVTSDLRIFPAPQDTGSQDPAQNFKRLRLISLLSPLFPVFLLACLTVLHARHLPSLLRWWGIPLLGGGLLTLFLAALLLPVFHYAVNSFLIPLLPRSIEANVIQAIAAVVQNIANRYTFWLGIEAGGLFLLGGVFLILSFIIHWKKH